MHKILIFEKKSFIKTTIEQLPIGNLGVEILTADTKEQALKLINDEAIKLILLDKETMGDVNNQEMDMQIQSQLKVKLPPVILFSQAKDITAQGFRFCNVKRTFSAPINHVELYETTEMILSSDVFINSLVEYHQSSDIALTMLSATKTIATKLELDDVKYALVVYALKILSVAIKNGSIQKTLQFCLNMGVHKKILQLIKSINNPKTPDEQFVYIMFEISKAFSDKKKLDEIKFHNVDAVMVEYIKYVIAERYVVVNCMSEFEIAWDMFLSLIFSEGSIAVERLSEYFDFIKRQIKSFIDNSLVCERDMLIKMSNQNDCVSYITFLERDDKMLAEKNILPAPAKWIEATIRQIDDKYALVIAMKINFIADYNARDMLINEFTSLKHISANDYIRSLSNIDISTELEEMREIEKAWEREISFCVVPSIDGIQELGRLVKRYGEIISNLFYEFEGLSYSLTYLGDKILGLSAQSNFSREKLHKATFMLGLLKEDLSNWREKVFIEQTVENIHYLDASMFVSCLSIEEILTGKKLSENSEEMIFF